MLNYTDNGHGKIIVLLHGFCESLNLWKQIEEQLSCFCRVICIDLPGYGDSRYLGEKISMEWFADQVDDLTQELNIKSYSVVGHSLGGYVSLALAEKFPVKIETMTLFHSTAFADTEEKKINRDKAAGFIERNGVDTFMNSFVAPLFAEPNREKCKADIANLSQDGRRSDQDAVINTIMAMKNRPDRTSVLNTFNKPALLIIGENDVAVPLEDSLKLAEMGSHTEALILKNCGHMGMFEKPSTTLTKLKEFLFAHVVR